ncbi:BnaC09g31040D [Brassica napus]|uniref:BnaC09g31040D protein n=1 Tax=Brassica napus TaxID=3708 RepID=A0A078IE48_BRANA|nr:BnaC09g31040D [Brassica napus]
MFRKILSLRHKALSFIRIEVRSRDSTFFWWDPWTPFGILREFLGSETSLGIPSSETLADLSSGNGWTFPNTENQVLLLSYITTLHLTTGSDQAVWSVNGPKCKNFCTKHVFNAIRRSMPQKHRFLWCGIRLQFLGIQPLLVVWRSMPRRFHLPSVPLVWADILLWLPNAHSDSMVKLAILQVWQAAIYELWKERNRWLHDSLTLPHVHIMRYISATLRDKCSALLSLGHPLGPRLAQFCFDPP